MPTPHLAEEVNFFDKDRTQEELENLTEEERELLAQHERQYDEGINPDDEESN